MDEKLEDKVDLIVDDFGLSDEIRSDSKSVLKNVFEEDLYYRFSVYGGVDAVCVFAVYAAAYMNHYPVDAGRLSSFASDCEDLDVSDYLNDRKIMKLRSDVCSELDCDKVVLRPEDYVNSMKSDIDMSEGSWRMVDDIIDRIEEFPELSSRSSRSLAATCIYIAAVLNDENLMLKDVCSSTGVSSTTVNTVYKFVIDVLTELDGHNINLRKSSITPLTLGLTGDYK